VHEQPAPSELDTAACSSDTFALACGALDALVPALEDAAAIYAAQRPVASRLPVARLVRGEASAGRHSPIGVQ
jgi:hypothetical protein